MAEIMVLANTARQNFVWIGLSLGLLLVGGIVAFILVRSRLRNGDDHNSASDTEVFSMEQLRRLRREGNISDGEYEVLKNQIIRNARL
ncbi:MAG: hypothetical protein JW709_13485 [Sedimentisphaerales bacterium]|nr:hypothetical protein [Sedimentisphaerales bacterium]